MSVGGFFFFIFKKIKISKIYVGFEKFQKYTPVALWGRQGSNVIFFLHLGPVAQPEGDRPPVAQAGGDRGIVLKFFETDIYF